MDKNQRRTLWVILGLGLLYFLAFVPVNLRGAESETMLAATSLDEPVTYPYVVRMLTPASGPKDLFERWVIYGDYHYGYPFYFFSAVTVLPVRLIHGARFTDFTQLNLLLLRQIVSVLPMVIAAGLLVYLNTRFRSLWASVGLFIFLLFIPGVVRQNIQWWHPDALSILAVVLTLFFLARDDLRFGKNFWLAAAACGLASGIKLAGVWFFLAIAVYLLVGLRQGKLTWPKAVGKGALFILIMLAVLVISNPFLYNSGARQEMIAIQQFKTVELDQGYSHDDPTYYQKGPQWWAWTLTNWYAHPLVLGLLLLSLVAGIVWGPNRLYNGLVLAWIVPFSIYLLYFVAVKPDHYWLPVLLPLFAGALNFPLALLQGRVPGVKLAPAFSRAVTLLSIVLLASYVTISIAQPFSGAAVRYQEGMGIVESLPGD